MEKSGLLMIRGVLAAAALLILACAVQLGFHLAFGEGDLRQVFIQSPGDIGHLRDLLNRNLNQVLGIVITAVAIGVSLTANMYSFKFLEFFIRDGINTVTIMFVIVVNLANTSGGFYLKGSPPDARNMGVLFSLTLVCFALVLPYMYYLFRFLHPQTLLGRLEGEFRRKVKKAIRGKSQIEKCRDAAQETIEHIGNIAIRSMDRGDRKTAIESVMSLERNLRWYWSLKRELKSGWFEAPQAFFLGFSSAAVEEICEKKNWVEMKTFEELRLIFNGGGSPMSKVVSSIVEAIHRLGLEETAKKDDALRELVIGYFNTLMRSAINRKDPRSIFLLLGQYERYAEALNDESAEAVLEIAYYLNYYAEVARESGLPFAAEVTAHDLGRLVESAWEAGAENREHLLDEFLLFDAKNPVPLDGVKKAHALLGSYFLATGRAEQARRVGATFRSLEAGRILSLTTDLMRVTREKYWEIHERGMNLDYVPSHRREKLREFLESLSLPEAGGNAGGLRR